LIAKMREKDPNLVSLSIHCQIKMARDQPSLEQLTSHKNESHCAWKKCKGNVGSA
jgi:hypothetical protein